MEDGAEMVTNGVIISICDIGLSSVKNGPKELLISFAWDSGVRRICLLLETRMTQALGRLQKHGRMLAGIRGRLSAVSRRLYARQTDWGRQRASQRQHYTKLLAACCGPRFPRAGRR